MAMVLNKVEAELVKITNFDITEKYEDRQGYLLALQQAVDQISNDEFDGLSNSASTWANNAVKAMTAKRPIPDFAGASSAVKEPEDEPDEEAGPVMETGTEDEIEEEDDTEETDDGPEKGTDEGSDAATEAEAESANEEVEAASSKAPKTAKAAKAPKAKPVAKAKVEATKGKVLAQAPKKGKVPPALTNRDLMDLPRDRFGVVEGSRSSEVVRMFEKSASMKDIKEKFGNNYYNILSRMVKEGHHLEKLEGGKMRLTHKDDWGKKAKAGSKKGK
jgi:hypothetical protein